MNPKTLQDFYRRVREQLFGHILPFWCGPALDREQGGWMAWLSNDLTPDRSQPKGLIVNSRILWAFSAAFRAKPDPVFRQMAQRAFGILFYHFRDTEFGGACWRLDGDHRTIDQTKKIYGQAFYIYALTEFHLAFGSTDQAPALAEAVELFELVEHHAHDPERCGYWEVRRRDWSEADDTRLSPKDMNEKRSMNNHLHILEAYTNLHRVWPNPLVAERLRELIAIFRQYILDPASSHLNHFFSASWEVRSKTYTFGHDIEASWLLCEAAEVLGDAALLAQVRAVALPIAEAVLQQGLGDDGGLFYEGEAGRVVDSGRECWPQAEAVVGFLNAFQISNDERYLAAAWRVWHFIEQHIVDRAHGEWFWRINPDGRPDAKLPKVSEWKGPYHGTRACLEAMRRLEQIAKP